jgi:hypothetical protein
MQLDGDEMLVLTLLQQLMIGRDLIAEQNPTREQTKVRFRDGFAQAAAMARWSRGQDLPGWARAGRDHRSAGPGPAATGDRGGRTGLRRPH